MNKFTLSFAAFLPKCFCASNSSHPNSGVEIIVLGLGLLYEQCPLADRPISFGRSPRIFLFGLVLAHLTLVASPSAVTHPPESESISLHTMNEVKTKPDAEPKRPWFEPLAAIVMALSTLSTAWCSYQSARWAGASGGHVRAAENLQRRAIALHLEANQLMTVQAQILMQWVNAHVATNDKLAEFYVTRFGPELKKAFAGWMAQKPFENATAAPHPFVPELYQSRFSADETQALAESARESEKATAGGQTGASYLSNTVLFATVLFFAGMSGKFEQRRVRFATMFFSLALFAFAAIRMLSLPVA